ncbi:MAG: ABC transporter permease [Pseudomonadota bacterium]|nr:ABC transporter permease [Pseudomonadota bacterium]
MILSSRPAIILGNILVTLVLIGLWKLCADLKLISPIYFPGPEKTFASIYDGFASGDLYPIVGGTVRRMFFGWFLATLLGVALGVLISSSRTVREYLSTSLEFIRPLPASALMPVAIALIGLSEGMILSVIAFGAIWPMLIGTVHGISEVEPRLAEVGHALRLNRWQVIVKIALPSALPDILANMRLGLTIALILAVVGEMLTNRAGLGSWILSGARFFRSQDIFAGVILLGLIGASSGYLLSRAEAYLLKWKRQS